MDQSRTPGSDALDDPRVCPTPTPYGTCPDGRPRRCPPPRRRTGVEDVTVVPDAVDTDATSVRVLRERG